jgi:ATP-binding cassette, subfamily B, bacterial
MGEQVQPPFEPAILLLSDAQSQVPDTQAAPKKRPPLSALLTLKPYIFRQKRMLAIAAVAMAVSALVMLMVPIAVRRMIDLGFSGGDGAVINSSFLQLIALGCGLAVASSARFFTVNWLGERVVADLRTDLFRHLITLGPSFYETTRSGEIMSRLTADTTQLKAASGSTMSQAARNLIMLLGAVTMMIATSPWLTSLVALAIPAIVFPLMTAGRAVTGKSRAAQDTFAEASAFAAENLAAIRTLQASTNERAVSTQFASASEAAFEAARQRLTSRAFLTAATILLVVGSIVGVLWYGASRVVTGELTGGTLGQFVLYALFAGGALAELAEVWGEVAQAAGAAGRLSELLAIQPSIRAPENPRVLPEPALGTIQFDNVSFRYPARPETSALDAVSFDIRQGETVAIVGPSGAGKSTLFSLILRFYDPTSGTVRVDGVPVAEADPEAVRRRIALVPQDVTLFAQSVADNIAYGASDDGYSIDRTAIEAAARAAEADGFIRALPQGYDTLVGERGVMLSGGQRQRIAIARAVLRNAPILLLDEATSALDAESEAAVQRALEGVMRNRTTLVIAHRLATVLEADRILVLDQGRIVEQGTHANLVADGKLYARLAELQFGDLKR